MIGLVVGWAVVLLAGAVWSAFRDPATVIEQSSLAEGRQALDLAVATLVEAAAPATAEVQPYQVTRCQINFARRGTEVDQTVVLTVPAGQEPTLLDRLVAQVPAQWEAHHSASNRFTADAGDFVAVRGEITEPGEVRLTAGTGCRPGTDPALPDGPQ